MKFNLKAQTPRLFLATLLALSAAASFAATGYTVTATEKSLIQTGMTSAQVQQTIGQPFNTVKFRNQEGPTWQYHMSGDAIGSKTFYIDFDAQGKVASVNEIEVAMGSGDSL